MAASDYHPDIDLYSDIDLNDPMDFRTSPYNYDEPRRLTTNDKLPRWSFNKDKEMKINKFYVGAAHIAESINNGKNSDWSHPTYEAAIEHAKALMEREDKDSMIIVQIIAVLKRRKHPIEVIKV